MPHWVDLALLADEASLCAALDKLTDQDREAAIKDAIRRLNVSDAEIRKATLRLLIERLRPYVLPASLWNRSVTASDDPRGHVRRHFKLQRIEELPARVDRAIELYNQFVVDREDARVPVTIERLKESDFHCQHCGLRFYNEELAGRGWVSPLKNRRKAKSDPLKPHWAKKDLKWRQPTVDHEWPISLYGDNRETNLRIFCQGCNIGKEQFLTLEQMKPWTGLPTRNDLVKGTPVSFDVFYAQLRRSPSCCKTGRTRADTELTVAVIDPTMAPLLDNLMTIESPD